MGIAPTVDEKISEADRSETRQFAQSAEISMPHISQYGDDTLVGWFGEDAPHPAEWYHRPADGGTQVIGDGGSNGFTR